VIWWVAHLDIQHEVISPLGAEGPGGNPPGPASKPLLFTRQRGSISLQTAAG
jgi:hypothetical protein